MSSKTKKKKKRKPLKITCTSSDCDNNLHCFKKSRQMAMTDRGKCRSCGADLIEWKRIHKRDVADARFTFMSLKYELIRHHYWHKPIDQRAINHARRKGRVGLQERARIELEKKVGKSRAELFRDGMQTPTEGNVIFYAQHALACCCRKCVEYWHNIPPDTPLSKEQLDYFVDLVMMYIDEKLPELTENGEKVPPIRRK